MLDWIPIEPLIDFWLRHGLAKLDSRSFYLFASYILLGWNVTKWEKQRQYGRFRDANDREQYRELAILNGRKPMDFIFSPNYTKGRLLRTPKYVVVHSMAGTMEGTISTFKNRKSERSAHYLIGHDGREVQMVDLKNTAWHAGVPFRFNNQDSIGIEHEGGTFPDGRNIHLGDAGYHASARRLAHLHRIYEWGEPSERTIVPHRSLKATACPSGLDVSRLISLAKLEYWGGQPVPLEEVVPTSYTEPVARRTFAPFNVNLAPSQGYRDEVRHVQEYLVARGYLTIDPKHYGYYGPKTQAAIDAFQKDNGIVAYKSYYGLWYDKTRAAANRNLTI